MGCAMFVEERKGGEREGECVCVVVGWEGWKGSEMEERKIKGQQFSD